MYRAKDSTSSTTQQVEYRIKAGTSGRAIFGIAYAMKKDGVAIISEGTSDISYQVRTVTRRDSNDTVVSIDSAASTWTPDGYLLGWVNYHDWSAHHAPPSSTDFACAIKDTSVNKVSLEKSNQFKKFYSSDTAAWNDFVGDMIEWYFNYDLPLN